MKKYISSIYALTAALLFGMNAPFSILLVREINPLFLAALLCLGAGTGILIIDFLRNYRNHVSIEAKLTYKEIPFIVSMVFLDIAAPIFLMLGLTMTNASTAALLGNFEIVATSIIAMIFFKEAIGKRLWMAIGLISLAYLQWKMSNQSPYLWEPY